MGMRNRAWWLTADSIRVGRSAELRVGLKLDLLGIHQDTRMTMGVKGGNDSRQGPIFIEERAAFKR